MLRKLPIQDGRGLQYAALPFIEEAGETKVLLVTSRETRRWVLPEGWAEKRLSGPDLAAKESFEEAGVRGVVLPNELGSYTYTKRLPEGRKVDCQVSVFPLRVEEILEDWPERDQRERQWFTFAQAAFMVEENELVTLLLWLAASELPQLR